LLCWCLLLIRIRIFRLHLSFVLFFFNDTATTDIYTLSLHDALPISRHRYRRYSACRWARLDGCWKVQGRRLHRDTTCVREEVSADRKSTRLNSSHDQISYAVFCLKKKKTK